MQLNWWKPRATRKSSTRLDLTHLESRDVPAQWFSVALLSPAEGVHGDSALTITQGGLQVAAQSDDGDPTVQTVTQGGLEAVTQSEDGGDPAFYADDEAAAIRAALSGSVVTGGTTYEFNADTLGTSPDQHRPFLLVPTADGYEIRLEDLASKSGRSDWDYNDASWKVSVNFLAPPTTPKGDITFEPLDPKRFEGHIKTGTPEVGGYVPTTRNIPISGSGGHAGTPYPKTTTDTPTPVTVKDPAFPGGKRSITISVETEGVLKPATPPAVIDPKKDPHVITITGKIVAETPNVKGGVRKPVNGVTDGGKPVTVGGKDDVVDKTQFPTDLKDDEIKKLIADAWAAAQAKYPDEPIWNQNKGKNKGNDTGTATIEVNNPMYPPPATKPIKIQIAWEYDPVKKVMIIKSAYPVMPKT